MENYDLRCKRLQDAIELKEPDRVPIAPPLQSYPVFNAGYTMKDVLYDYDKGAESFKKFATQYEPDAMMGHVWLHMGAGPILELMKPKSCMWAGQPNVPINDDSIHQFIEFPVLSEEEMDFFDRDYSGWLLERGYPKISELLEPFATLGVSRMTPAYDISGLAASLSSPEVRTTIETLWKINDMRAELRVKEQQLDADLEGMGFPILSKGFAAVPFDMYSDFYRGTIESMTDLYDHEDTIIQFCETQLRYGFDMIEVQGQFLKNMWVFMPLHKGMDGFMSDEQYRKFYWNDLQAIINKIIDNGMTPYIYTEGKYDSRLECLKEVPRGKVLYHFEEVDMVQAKKVLGDTACISGGFPIYLLEYGTKQQVIDECKRLIDGCAAGGGFIFETGSGFDHAKPENVEAMFDTVKTYGKK